MTPSYSDLPLICALKICFDFIKKTMQLLHCSWTPGTPTVLKITHTKALSSVGESPVISEDFIICFGQVMRESAFLQICGVVEIKKLQTHLLPMLFPPHNSLKALNVIQLFFFSVAQGLK